MHEVCKPKEVFVIGEQFHYYKSWCPGIYRRIDREVGTYTKEKFKTKGQRLKDMLDAKFALHTIGRCLC